MKETNISSIFKFFSNQNFNNMNVAVHGVKGSFHHMVANKFFGDDIALTECLSFTEIPELLRSGAVETAIMAIENTNTGTLLSNYISIDKHDLNIQGEFYLPTQYHLMALKGQALSDIEEVWSHPIAIKNCESFFRRHPHIKIIEEKDTAFVAKQIKDLNIKGIAAIASQAAANIYDLNILKKSIQGDALNITRFFILNRNRDFTIDVNLHNKASLKFITNHELGSLAEILNICAKHTLNLSRIQSMPLTNKPWNYAFFLDITFTNYLDYCNALLEIEKKVIVLKILGEYSQAKAIMKITSV